MGPEAIRWNDLTPFEGVASYDVEGRLSDRARAEGRGTGMGDGAFVACCGLSLGDCSGVGGVNDLGEPLETRM